MRIQIDRDTERPVEALRDTWGWNQDGYCWGMTLVLGSPDIFDQKLNEWSATILEKTLEIFSDLTRVWKIIIVPEPTSEAEVTKIEWCMDNSYQEYISNILKTIKEYPFLIDEIIFDVDLFVYIHLKEFPEKTIRKWIRLPDCNFNLSALQSKKIFILFEICHTIFGPANKQYGPITGSYPEPEEDFSFDLDNNELQLLNQPLLEKALRGWEKHFGDIDYIEGFPGIFKYGFLVEPY